MSFVTSSPTTLTPEVADNEAASGAPERFAFRQGANVAQAFGHDAVGRGRNINAQPLGADFQTDGESFLFQFDFVNFKFFRIQAINKARNFFAYCINKINSFLCTR